MKKILLITSMLLLVSCKSPEKTFVEHERSQYNSLAPWIRSKADESLLEDKAKLQDLEAWDAVLDIYERKLDIKKVD